MPNLPFQILTITADLVLFLFVGYYFFRLRAKEKELLKKETLIDSNYHQIVDTALSKERRILEDATLEANKLMETAAHEANQILAGSKYINEASKQTVDQALNKMVADIQSISQQTKQTVDQTLHKMADDIQTEARATSQAFMQSYQASLKQVAAKSLQDVENVTKELETDLQKQVKAFHENLLPTLEKELAAYKKTRMEQTDKSITRIVQKVSQEILNKSISLDDHQELVLSSLEKAKKEGVFD